MFRTPFETVADNFKLASVSKPAIAGVLALLVMVAVAVGRIVIDTATASAFEIEQSPQLDVSSGKQESDEVEKTIAVHIAGCVANPGVVKLPADSRVVDAVEAAGGFSEGAQADGVNLARVLKDGEQVLISSVADVQVGNGTAEPSEMQVKGASAQGQTGLVNINTASSTELQTLPGIGAATAAKIVEYRKANGSFSSCEDLKNVSGIGDKKYEAIAGQICV